VNNSSEIGEQIPEMSDRHIDIAVVMETKEKTKSLKQ
jgi:hypothetical protein